MADNSKYILELQKQQIEKNGGTIVNPSVDQSVYQNGASAEESINNYNSISQADKSNRKDVQDIINEAKGYASFLGNKIISGGLNPFESLAKLPAIETKLFTGDNKVVTGVLGVINPFYAIGRDLTNHVMDVTGKDDSKIDNFINTNYTEQISDWLRAYGSEYNGIKNLAKLSMGVNNGIVNPLDELNPQSMNAKDVIQEKYDTSLENTYIGRVIGNALESTVSSGITSGMGSGITDALGGSEYVAQMFGEKGMEAISMIPFGASAFGNSFAENYRQTGDSSKAFTYATLSTATELASELFIGDLLETMGIGKHVANINGHRLTNSNLTGKTVGTAIAKDILGQANEEGVEEIASEIVSPIWQYITGMDTSEYKYDGKYSVLKHLEKTFESYLTGAISGGTSVTSRDILLRSELGKNGTKALVMSETAKENIAKAFDKYKNEKITLDEYYAIQSKSVDQIVESIKLVGNMNERQRSALLESLQNPSGFAKKIEELYAQKEKLGDEWFKENIDTESTKISKQELAYLKGTLTQDYIDSLGAKFNNVKNGETQIIVENMDDNKNAYYSSKENAIHFNIKEVRNRYATHEYFHRLFDKNVNLRTSLLENLKDNKLLNKLQSSKEITKTIITNYKSLFEEISKDVIVKDSNGNIDIETSLENIKNNAKTKDLYDSELLSHYVENVVTNDKEMNRLFKSINSYDTKSRLKSALTKARNSLTSKGQLYDELSKAISKIDSVNVKENIKENDSYSISGAAMYGGMRAIIKDGNVIGFEDFRGNKITTVTEDMIKKSTIGAMLLSSVENGNLTKEQCDKQISGFTTIMQMIVDMKDIAMVQQLTGSMIFSPIKSNSDSQYSYTVDFETICKKTKSMINAMSEKMLEYGRGLTVEEIDKLYDEQVAKGELTPCPMCYVFSRWLAVGGVLDKLKNFQEKYRNITDKEKKKILDEVDKKVKELYPNKTASKARSDIQNKLNRQIEKIESSIDIIRSGDNSLISKYKNLEKTSLKELLKERQKLIDELTPYQAYAYLKNVQGKEESVPDSVLYDLNNAEEFATKYPLAWKWRTNRGTRYGKAITPYADVKAGQIIEGIGNKKALNNVSKSKLATYNEVTGRMEYNPINMFTNLIIAESAVFSKDAKKLIASARSNVLKQNLKGGVRTSSYSDFRRENLLDYIMEFLELQTIGAKGQVYTKVVEAVQFYDSVGYCSLMSLMPLGKGYRILNDGTYELLFSNRTGIDAETAFDLVQKCRYASTIMVGISDTHIKLCLNDLRIQVVIPYHSSGGNMDVIRSFLESLKETDVDTYTSYENWQEDEWLEPSKLTSEQKSYRALRAKILKKSTSLTNEELAKVKKDKHLNNLYNILTSKEYKGVSFGATESKTIYPYEFWDKTVDYEHSDVNSRGFKEYCDKLGVKPRFYELFGEEKYYWKTFVDRKMYSNDGKYIEQPYINITEMDYVNTDSKRFKNTQEKIAKRNAEIRYSLSQDSEGNTLTKEQEKYFEYSLVRDDNYALKVLYHGTANGGFSIFDKNQSIAKEKRDSYYGENVIFLTDNSIVSNLFGNNNNVIDGKSISKYQKDIKKYDEMVNTLNKLNGDDFMDYYNSMSDFYLNIIGRKTFDGQKVESKIVKDGDKYVWIYAIGESIDEKFKKEKSDTKYYRTYNADKIKEIILDNISVNKDDAKLNGTYKVYANITNPLIVDVDSEDNHWYGFTPTYISDNKLYRELMESESNKLTTDGIVYWMIKNHKNKEYDGVIINGVVEGGNNVPSNVYIAFNSYQIKNVDNLHPTSDDDIRYSLKTTDDYIEKLTDEYIDEHWKENAESEFMNYTLDDYNEMYDTEFETLEEAKKHFLNKYDKYNSEDYEYAKQQVIEGLKTRYDKLSNDIYKDINKYVNSLNEQTDNKITFDNQYSRSWSAGNFPSWYLKFDLNDGNDFEIRISDGHDNGRGGSTDITYMDLDYDYNYTLDRIKEEIRNNLEYQDGFDDIRYSIVSIGQSDNQDNANKTKSNNAKSNIPSFDALKTSYVEWHKDEILYISKAEELVKLLKGDIESTLERELGVKVESTFKIGKTAEKLFDAKNFDEGTIDSIIDEIVTSEYIVYVNDNKFEKFIISDLNTNEFKTKLKELLNTYVELSVKETKKAKSENQLKELLEKWTNLEKELRIRAKDLSIRIRLVRQIQKRTYTIPQNFDLNLKITDDNIAYHSASFLMQPLLNIAFQGDNYNSRGLKDALTEILKKYNANDWDNFYQTNEKGEQEHIDPLVPYNDDLRQQLEVLRDSIPEPKEIKLKDGSKALRYSGLSNESLARLINCIDYINKLYKEQSMRELKEFKPDAIQSSNAINKKWTNNKSEKFFRRVFNRLSKGIASAYAPIRMLLGKSRLSDMITIDMSEAMNKSKLYNGDIKTQISDKIKELKINKKLGKKYEFKSFTPKGDTYKLTGDELVYLYLTLNSKENFNAVEKSGFVFDDVLEHTLIASGQAEIAKEWINKNLDNSLKEYGDFLKDLMNNKIQKDYIAYFRERYGREPNEIKDYWTLLRKYDKATSIEKAIYSAEMFSSEKTRTNNDLPVRLASATNTVNTYSRQLGNQKYVLPIYRDVIRLLNTKVDETSRRTLKHDLSKTIGDENFKYIMNVLDEMVGKKDATYYGWLKGLTSGYTMKLLSFNLGTTLKQFASLYTSNLPIKKSTKGFIQKIFNKDAKFKKEYQELTQEIGSIKYRNYGGVVEGEGVSVISTIQKPAEFGMKPVTWNDYVTITTGMATLMVIAKENGFEYGTKANKDFVKEHYNEFILSQIASNPLSLNEIARGKGAFGQISKYLFGFMQGANRVAVASQMNKIQIYNECRKVDIEQVNKTKTTTEENIKKLEKTLKQLQEELDDYILELQDDGYSISELKQDDMYRAMLKDIENVRNKIILEQSVISECDVTIREYKEYEIMGGKWIPVNMASGLLAQGIFVTLVNELMKHLKGKKDWDDWEFINNIPDFLLELAMNTLVGWIPVVNVLVNKIAKGYDIEVANAVFLNDILSVGETIYTNIKNIANGDSIEGKDILDSCITTASDITGLPIETLYGYVNGIIRAFDPETAMQNNNLFYGYTYSGQLSQYKSAIESGNTKASQRNLDTLMSNYKVDASTSVKNEINALYTKGYKDAMPKSYMTSYYDENGDTVKLSNAKQTSFKQYYNQSKNDADKLLYTSEYKKASQENKAKYIRKLYDAYYSYAKAKTLGTTADSKLGNLLLYTNGKTQISKYIGFISNIQSLTATTTKTKKELAIEYVNKLALSSKEKLLLLELCGYKASGTNKTTLSNYLRQLGMSSKQIEEFL